MPQRLRMNEYKQGREVRPNPRMQRTRSGGLRPPARAADAVR